MGKSLSSVKLRIASPVLFALTILMAQFDPALADYGTQTGKPITPEPAEGDRGAVHPCDRHAEVATTPYCANTKMGELQSADPDAYIVCVEIGRDDDIEFSWPKGDGTDASPASTETSGRRRRTLIPPNSRTVVTVASVSCGVPDVALSGNVSNSLFLSGKSDQEKRLAANRLRSGKLDNGAWTVTQWPFEAREPGPVNLTVTVYEHDDAAKKRDELKDRKILSEKKLELIADKGYFGALRIGTAIVFGNAVDRRYSGENVGSSEQREVVASRSGDADVELTAGFTLYPEAFTGRGRSYAAENLSNWCLGTALKWWPGLDDPPPLCAGLYVGLGLLGENENIADGFQSFHYGLDIEIYENLSVVFGGTLRNVKRLRNGVTIGSPLEDDASPSTTSQFEPGFAISINYSPDLFKALSGGLGFGKKGDN